MDSQYFTGTTRPTTQALGKEGFSKLIHEQLKLKEVQVSECFNSKVVKVLENYNIKYELRYNKLLVEPSGGTHIGTECEVLRDKEVKEGIPYHCLLTFKTLEDNRMSPILLESYRFNENIIDDTISHSLPVASLSVSTDHNEHQGLRTSHNLDTVSNYTRSKTSIHGPVSSRTRSKKRERKQDYVELLPNSKRLKVDRQLVRKPCNEHTCMHVAMYQTALTSLSKPNQPRFLTTTHVYDCHAVVFWDKNTQTAIMTHFMQDHMCEQSFDFMLSKITQYAPVKNLTAFIVGGIVGRMRYYGNFFDFIEKYLNEKNITLKQTFLGDKKRPADLMFDCQEGCFYELKITHKGQYEFDLTDNRTDLAYSFRTSFENVTYYYTSENENHFIPVTLNFSLS